MTLGEYFGAIVHIQRLRLKRMKADLRLSFAKALRILQPCLERACAKVCFLIG